MHKVPWPNIGYINAILLGALSRETVKPGESGLLEITVDLAEKRGYFSSLVAIETNDPLSPTWLPRVSAGVYQSTISPIQTLYFGNVVQGQSVGRRFLVHDRGDKSLEVRDCRIEFGGRVTRYVDASATITRLAATMPVGKARGSFKPLPGDYRIDVSLRGL